MSRPRPHAINMRNWPIDPLALLDRWPSDQPVAMLHSGRLHRRWARWSVLARPDAMLTIDDHVHWQGNPPADLKTFTPTGHPLTDLSRIFEKTTARRSAARTPHDLPFTGGWIGCFAYDLGRIIEPRATHPDSPVDDRHWPLVQLAWCPHALVYDHLHAKWYEVNPADAPTWLNNGIDFFQKSHPIRTQRHATNGVFTLGRVTAELPPDAYLHMVQRALDYIAAGDIFQANLTQRLTGPFEGSTRALARRALTTSGAWYGAYVEWPDGRTLLSLSPELLLKIDHATNSDHDRPPRHIITRPIKGTRPGHVAAQELESSEKDAAELNMIIDLMRNDLGRVCEFGSVRVPHGRIIESHPTVHHGVGEVHGTLREHIMFTDLLRAVFPGGSVTGAPKIRAMQIIDEHEPVRRGPYCGAIGCVSADGRAQLNIAIRTIALHGDRPANLFDQLHGVLDYGTGGGIVADSDPADELRECYDKAAVLRMVTDSSHTTQSR